MVEDQVNFTTQQHIHLEKQVESAIELFQTGDYNSLGDLLSPLLPHVGILMHLKICSQYSEFGNSDLLQYTLLPQINTCSDFTFLKNTPYNREATQCLTTLGKFFKTNQYQITNNFAQFALTFEGYECLIVAYSYEDNQEAVEKGLQSCGISPDVIDIFTANLGNFMLPSVYTFLKKLLPTMQYEYSMVLQQLHIPSDHGH